MDEFSLVRPARQSIPVLIEVPHAGRYVPPDLCALMCATERDRLRDADLFVDELVTGFDQLGATVLVARASRYVVDLNRARGDVDAALVPDHPRPVADQPRGVVWRLTTEEQPIWQRPLTNAELEQRLARYWDPYHRMLQDELNSLRERHGYVVLVATHSMPSVGRAGHSDEGDERADIVPGTVGRTSASGALIDLVDTHFREAGFSVEHDRPYRGGYTTVHYGRPAAHQHAIQIEINRKLYMDEDKCVLNPSGAVRLRDTLRALVKQLPTVRV